MRFIIRAEFRFVWFGEWSQAGAQGFFHPQAVGDIGSNFRQLAGVQSQIFQQLFSAAMFCFNACQSGIYFFCGDYKVSALRFLIQ